MPRQQRWLVEVEGWPAAAAHELISDREKTVQSLSTTTIAIDPALASLRCFRPIPYSAWTPARSWTTAGDSQLTGDVEIANADHVICTLNEIGSIELEAKVTGVAASSPWSTRPKRRGIPTHRRASPRCELQPHATGRVLDDNYLFFNTFFVELASVSSSKPRYWNIASLRRSVTAGLMESDRLRRREVACSRSIAPDARSELAFPQTPATCRACVTTSPHDPVCPPIVNCATGLSLLGVSARNRVAS